MKMILTVDNLEKRFSRKLESFYALEVTWPNELIIKSPLPSFTPDKTVLECSKKAEFTQPDPNDLRGHQKFPLN